MIYYTSAHNNGNGTSYRSTTLITITDSRTYHLIQQLAADEQNMGTHETKNDESKIKV